MIDTQPLTLTPKQAAKVLGLSTEKVRELIANGDLFALDLGPRTKRIPQRAIEKFIGE